MENLSPITLGTMRFLDKGLSVDTVKRLLNFAHDHGVTSLHVSPEYSSYGLVKAASQGDRHQFMVKISAPHFDEENFSKQSLFKRVDDFLRDFQIDTIGVVQWMWRMNPLDDDQRIKRSEEQLSHMKEAFNELVTVGKVRAFSCFPYTPRYMKFVRENDLMSSQTNYLNFWEDDLYEGGVTENSIALRPLAAGQFRESDFSLSHCLNYVLSHPNIKSAVISMHTNAQIKEIASIANKVKKSEVMFNAYREAIA